MIANSWRFQKMNVRAATALIGLLAVSCAPQYSSPQQVRASNPSVTYKYRSDQDLLQVNQSAMTFCNQYRATPRPANFTSDPDGSKVVVFECVQTTAPTASPAQFNPNLTYNYRTDPELLDASQNAQKYCTNNGFQQVTSSITVNPNGTKTVTFQCRRP